MIDAKTMALSVVLDSGSTTTAGTGALTFSLPVSSADNVQEIHGKVDANGDLFAAVGEIAASSDIITVYVPSGTANTVLTTLPNTAGWSSTSSVVLSGVIEIA
jgi:hypothetical protein